MRGGALAACCLAACCLAACARGPAAGPAQAAALAGWIEDVVRGLPRDPDELAVEGGGPAQAAAAAWLRGGAGPRSSVPRPLAARHGRWGDLRGALADGALVTVPGLGLVAPRPGLARAARLRAEALADAENLDRRTIDRALLGFGLDPAVLLPAAAAARDAADAQAGGRPWRPARE